VAPGCESPPGLRRFARVARIPGAAILGLQKVEETEAVSIERVLARTGPTRGVMIQRLPAPSNRTAKDHSHLRPSPRPREATRASFLI
jgi:hypothetical protein